MLERKNNDNTLIMETMRKWKTKRKRWIDVEVDEVDICKCKW